MSPRKIAASLPDGCDLRDDDIDPDGSPSLGSDVSDQVVEERIKVHVRLGHVGSASMVDATVSEAVAVARAVARKPDDPEVIDDPVLAEYGVLLDKVRQRTMEQIASGEIEPTLAQGFKANADLATVALSLRNDARGGGGPFAASDRLLLLIDEVLPEATASSLRSRMNGDPVLDAALCGSAPRLRELVRDPEHKPARPISG